MAELAVCSKWKGKGRRKKNPTATRLGWLNAVVNYFLSVPMMSGGSSMQCDGDLKALV